MMHEYETSDEWYEALVAVAKRHENKSGVRDREGWTMNWENETPEQAYYGEFTEHTPKNSETGNWRTDANQLSGFAPCD